MNPVTSPRRSDTFTHRGFAVAPDPLAGRRRPGASALNALLATALFRCWHILLAFGAWATLITVLDHHKFKVRVSVTLLTVVGTVLGFIISYRTTTAFERYNEGRRLWSQIILASRTFARTTWFHVPDIPVSATVTAEQSKARSMIEKKTAVNLLEAFGVAVKHYLRGEDGIYYQDLYYLVKFLPAYALPPGIPANADLSNSDVRDSLSYHGAGGGLSPTSARHPSDASSRRRPSTTKEGNPGSFLYQRSAPSTSAPHLPMPATTPGHVKIEADGAHRPPPLTISPPTALNSPVDNKNSMELPSAQSIRSPRPNESQKVVLARQDEGLLLPGKLPPRYHLFDIFPFSLLVRRLTNRGHEVKGKKAARLRAKMLREKDGEGSGTHNLPLEITLYLSSYIAALQNRKQTDVPTTNTLLAALNQLVDALTGLERILTTPIPFSYSFHLWAVATIYILAIPSQIVSAFGWVTIPATVLLSFIFFGFIVAGEEIENPFGYDKNDLNLDHFTNSVIRYELRAITSAPAPDPSRWAFSAENDMLFVSDVEKDERVTPEEWVRRGNHDILVALDGSGRS